MIRRLAPAVALAMVAARPVPAFELQLGVGLQAHELREHGTNGDTLVREHGTSPRLAAAVIQPLGDAWSARGAVVAWAGRAGYDGQTQGGVPMESRTDSRSMTVEGTLQWQPPAFGAIGVEAGLQLERFRRRLNGVGAVGGLDERLTQPRWLLGVDWRGEAWSLRAGALWGARAPLAVRFEGDLYDPVQWHSGRARGWMVQAGRSIAQGWRLVAGFESLGVGRSGEATLTRGGRSAGIVVQPRWRRDTLALTLERSLEF